VSVPIVVVLVVAAIVVIGVIAVYEIESKSPPRETASFQLGYASSPPWSNQSGLELAVGSNVTVAWATSAPVSGIYVAIVQGGDLVFSGGTDAGNGSFLSAGGPLTISATGIVDPAVMVNVAMTFPVPPAAGPIA
jgi:hypothetical protein